MGYGGDTKKINQQRKVSSVRGKSCQNASPSVVPNIWHHLCYGIHAVNFVFPPHFIQGLVAYFHFEKSLELFDSTQYYKNFSVGSVL